MAALIITGHDLLEFNWYIKSKVYQSGPRKGQPFIPRLREKFPSDSDYEDFIIRYQDNLHNPCNN